MKAPLITMDCCIELA